MLPHVNRALSDGISAHPLGCPYIASTVSTSPQLARRQSHLRRRNCANGGQCDTFLGTHGNGNTFGCTGSTPRDPWSRTPTQSERLLWSLVATLIFNSPHCSDFRSWELLILSNKTETESQSESESESKSQVGALFVRPLRCSPQERVTHWTPRTRTAGLELQCSRSPAALSPQWARWWIFRT